MEIIKRIQNLFTVKQTPKNTTHEREIRQYVKDAVKTYKKTLRKLAHE